MRKQGIRWSIFTQVSRQIGQTRKQPIGQKNQELIPESGIIVSYAEFCEKVRIRMIEFGLWLNFQNRYLNICKLWVLTPKSRNQPS
jgi:hypothetical protein